MIAVTRRGGNSGVHFISPDGRKLTYDLSEHIADICLVENFNPVGGYQVCVCSRERRAGASADHSVDPGFTLKSRHLLLNAKFERPFMQILPVEPVILHFINAKRVGVLLFAAA